MACRRSATVPDTWGVANEVPRTIDPVRRTVLAVCETTTGTVPGAAISGFVVLLLTLWLGRRVESGVGRMLVLLTGLGMATAAALLVLEFAGA